MADIKITLEFWLGEISREFHVTDTHAVFFDDIESLHNAFAQRRVDIIMAPPLEIVCHFDQAMLCAGLIGATNTDIAASLTLLVNKNRINDFKKLRGKRL